MKQGGLSKKQGKRKVNSVTSASDHKTLTTTNGASRKPKKRNSKTAATDNIHYVLPIGNGWVIKASRSKTFLAISDSKPEAISIARTAAKTKHTELIVYFKNGKVQIWEDYSKTPAT